MALKAGRHGVSRRDIDTRTGRLKEYELPTATSSRLGGVKVGSGLNVTASGVLSAPAEVPAYAAADAGKVLTVNEDGDLIWQEKGAGGGLAVGDIIPYAMGNYLFNLTNYALSIDTTNNVLVASESESLGFKGLPGSGTGANNWRFSTRNGQKVGVAFIFVNSYTAASDISIRMAIMGSGTPSADTVIYEAKEFTIPAGTVDAWKVIETIEFTPSSSTVNFVIQMNDGNGWVNPVSALQLYPIPYKPAE